MKDPDAFGRTQHDEHEREVRFELDGNDRNLIPVPLGERTKSGVLELRICDQYFRVHKFIITATIRYFTDELAPTQGKHFLYGTPEKPDALFSDYDSEMFGMAVKIERLKTEKDRVGSASITFPSGLRLPGTLISTRITNISKVDVSKIHFCRILFKISGRDQFEARIMSNTLNCLRPSSALKPHSHKKQSLDANGISARLQRGLCGNAIPVSVRQ
jgi:hypothetical protein